MTQHRKSESIVIGVDQDVQAVAPARLDLARAAHGWGMNDLEGMEVVIAELVTNAIVHAQSSPIVRLSRCGPEQVRVEVTDERADLPLLVQTYDNHTRGLGLQIVGALSTTWGVERGASSKTVWSEIDLST